jgi:membrane-associated protease RseP (regulator of RpoE activity)
MQPSSSLLFAGLYKLATGEAVTQSIRLGPVAFAGWLGLVVTALNLAPVGQLDGGHIAYAILGRSRARVLGSAAVMLMVAAGLFYSAHWLTWAVIIYFLAGTGHPAAKNEVAGVGAGRKILGFVALALVAAIVLPAPA